MAESDDEHAARQLQLQALLNLYNEQCTHGRHTEAQRHAVSAMFLATAGVFISVIGAMRFGLSMAPLALCVVLLGIYARLFLRQFEKKWDQLAARRERYREQVLALVEPTASGEPGGKAGAATAAPEGEQSAADTGEIKKTLRLYWRHTFTAVSLVGLLCLGIIIAKAGDPRLGQTLAEFVQRFRV